MRSSKGSTSSSERGPRAAFLSLRDWPMLVAIAVLAAGVASAGTVIAGASNPKAALAVSVTSFDFGSLLLGDQSATKTTSFPLSTTLGAQRTLIESAINNASVSDVVLNNVVIITGAQLKASAVAALDGLPDSTVLAFKVDQLALDSGADFNLSGDCLGADGASTASCTVGVQFAPHHGGTRTDGVSAGLSATSGYDTILNAIASQIGASLGLPGAIVSAVLPFISDQIRPLVNNALNASVPSPFLTATGFGIVTVSAPASFPVAEGQQGSHVVDVPVTLNSPSTVPVLFNFKTVDGTATVADHDYKATSGQGTVPAGSSSTVVPVSIEGDTTPAADEGFFVELSSPSSSAALGPHVTKVDILNDDVPTVSVVGSTVPEGAPAYFSLTLAQPLNRDLTLRLQLAPSTATASRYGALSAPTITFDAGTTGPLFVWCPTILDHRHEPADRFKLVVQGARKEVSVYSGIAANDS